MLDFITGLMSDLGIESGSSVTVDHIIMIIAFVCVFEFLSSFIYVIVGGLRND